MDIRDLTESFTYNTTWANVLQGMLTDLDIIGDTEGYVLIAVQHGIRYRIFSLDPGEVDRSKGYKNLLACVNKQYPVNLFLPIPK